MKIVQLPPSWLLWTLLCCFVLLASSTDDDLLDFDFTDLKEIDWNYETDNSKELLTKGTTQKNIITFGDDSDLLEENQVHPFDWREKVLRTALSKALMNKAVRQKFVEVMPILRVLTRQQRLALSALITAQINAKKGNELKLEQVRMMFGDDKSLILPIVFDIANLVRNSAKKYIEFDYNLADFGDFSKPKISFERRNLQVTPGESAKEHNSEGIGTLPAAAQIAHNFDLEGLEDFMSEEVLDPKEINKELEFLKAESNTNSGLDDVSLDMELEEDEENHGITSPLDINIQLQRDTPTLAALKLDKNHTKELLAMDSDRKSLKRLRRSARNSREFVHKLVRSVPLSINEEELQRGSLGRTLKLNTTAFASPKETTIRAASKPTTLTISTSTKPPIIITPETLAAEDSYEPYHLVEDLAFASLNGSEIFLDDSDNDENDLISEGKSEEPDDEILPTPEELIAGPRYRLPSNKLSSVHRKISRNKRKRIPMRARPKKATHGNGVTPPKKCERFTASMCIKTDDYPIDHIMGSIRRHRNAMTALLAEYNDNPSNTVDTSDDFDEYLYGKKRREDTDVQGELCQSIVRYARPQKARSASGEWKYIVNTGQHTQTLRLEKCMNPQESCSYLAPSYRSHCAQVYNYHRLLSWDKTRGLHVDIFKVPTCCSCQIDGYKQPFIAQDINSKAKGFTPVFKGNSYRQPQKQYDYNDEEEDETDDFDFAIQRKQIRHDTSFDADELSSNKIKSKLPQPTVGSYLSPPASEPYEEEYSYKYPRDTASFAIQHSPSSTSSQSSTNYYLKQLQNQRPHQFYKDSRSDQDLSPSEQHAEREVNVIGTVFGQDDSTHQKRKNIYSVTQIANTGSSGTSDSSTTTIAASTGTIPALTTPTTIRFRRPTPVDTNAHQKPSLTATTNLPTTPTSPSPTPSSTSTSTAAAAPTGVSTTAPSLTIGTAVVPSYYFPRSRHVLKNQSRLRIPYTIPSANAGANGCPETSTTAPTEHEHEVPTTTVTSSSSQQPNIYAVNQKIFKNRYKTKFSLTYTTTPSLSNSSSPSSLPTPPKRINYNYHPIIDFFEYSKRIVASSTTSTTTSTLTSTTTTTTTTTTTPQPLITALEPEITASPSSSSVTSVTHSYPYKINKPAPVLNYQKPSPVYGFKSKRFPEHQQHRQQQQLKYRPQQSERRIGNGAAAAAAAAAVAAATDGDVLSRSSSGVVPNTPEKITNTHLNFGKRFYSTLVAPPSGSSSVAGYESSLAASIWQPLIVQDF